MQVIIKASYNPVIYVKSGIKNDVKSIGKVIDSENICEKEIGNGICMYYDGDGFAKTAPANLADGYTGEVIYGDIVFCNRKSGCFTSLTDKQKAIVERYCNKHRVA